MTAREVAQDHYATRKRLARQTAEEAVELWQEIDPSDLASSWLRRLARLFIVLSGAQLTAARSADSYADTVLAEQGFNPRPTGRVQPRSFSGVASDGRPLETLLQQPVITTKIALLEGKPMRRALATGRAHLDMIVRTQVADAGRVADGVAVASRPQTGWIRMLVPPGDCSRCVILAGRRYRYNQGFLRHPDCNCIHVPTQGVEAAEVEGLVFDPRAYFDTLSEAEQDKAFTKAGAQAIRDGADMAQVVNARRGMSYAGGRLTREERRLVAGGDRARLQRTNVFGQDVFVTTEGTTTRGIAGRRLIEQGAGTRHEAAETVTRRSSDGDVDRQVQRRRVQTPRLMPESIYELATSRDDAIRLLRRFGYII